MQARIYFQSKNIKFSKLKTKLLCLRTAIFNGMKSQTIMAMRHEFGTVLFRNVITDANGKFGKDAYLKQIDFCVSLKRRVLSLLVCEAIRRNLFRNTEIYSVGFRMETDGYI